MAKEYVNELTSSGDTKVTLDREEEVVDAKLAVTNALDFTAYDLNAAAFSEVTDIDNDYILDNIEFNFSTTEERTIVITSADGTEIYRDTNTTKNLVIKNIKMAFNGGENITVDVTQLSNAGTMDCVLKIQQGTSALSGNPGVQIIDENGTAYGVINSNNAIATCPEEHHTAFNGVFTATAGGDIAAQAIITPSSGSKIGVHVVSLIATDGSSGKISLDFLTSSCPVMRVYPSKNSQASSGQDHTEGAVDEVLTLEASSIGNGSEVFVKIQYIEE